MTKKDFDLIADAFKLARSQLDPTRFAAVDFVASKVADAIQATHPRFDRDRFLAACGHAAY